MVMMVKDRRDFVKMIKDGKFTNSSGIINNTSKFYQCDYYPDMEDKSSYNISEIYFKDAGYGAVIFLTICLIVGTIGMIFNLVPLMELYIIPEMEIINYITSMLN